MDTTVRVQPVVSRVRRVGPPMARFAVCLTLALLTVLVCTADALAYVSGKQVWVKHYGTQARPGEAHTVAAGPGGAVCVVGSVAPAGSPTHDILVMKYNAGGARKWVRTYDGPAHGDDLGLIAAFDARGNTYVAGQSGSAAGDGDIVVLKYSVAGKQLWARRYDGPAHLIDEPTGLTVDLAGNVYVAGSSRVTDQLFGIVVLKYDTGGHRKWVSRFDPSPTDAAAGTMFAFAIALDAAGNAYVVGESRYSNVTSALTLKLSGKNGHKIAGQIYPGDTSSTAVGQQVAVRGKSVVITGWIASAADAFQTDIMVVKYDLALKQKWAYRHDGPAHMADGGHAVAIDAAGNVFVVGSAGVSAADTGSRCATLKVSATGNLKWAAFLLPAGYGSSDAEYVAVDAAGAAYVGGTVTTVGEGSSFLVAKYTAAGASRWSHTWRDAAAKDALLQGVALGAPNAVYVAGTGTDASSVKQTVLIKYLR
jgi:Beta-propeller repeat